MQVLADIPSDGFGVMKEKQGECWTQQERQGSLARLSSNFWRVSRKREEKIVQYHESKPWSVNQSKEIDICEGVFFSYKESEMFMP